jgi:RNA polymerase sigma-70 factor, ECF subfamily
MQEKTLRMPLAQDRQIDLVQAALQGNAGAFGQLAKECEGTLYRVARTVLRSDQDCADAIQEALSKAWLRLHTLREPQYFNTWLIRILLNECYRQIKRNKRTEGPALYELPNDGPGGDELIDLKRAMEKLPLKHRTAVMLYHVEELTVEEIARTLNVPVGTVKSRLARARAKLAASMKLKE